MPRVPVAERRGLTAPLRAPDVTVPAGLGAGLAAVGRVGADFFNQLAENERAKSDESAVLKFTTSMAEIHDRLFDGPGGVSKLLGEDAIDPPVADFAMEQYEKEVGEAYALLNERQQRIAARDRAADKIRFGRRVHGHEATQRDAVEVARANSDLERQARIAQSMGAQGDVLGMMSTLNDAVQRSNQFADTRGKEAEVQDADMEKYVSAVISSAILSRASSKAPGALDQARVMRKEWDHNLTQEHRESLDKQFESLNLTDEAVTKFHNLRKEFKLGESGEIESVAYDQITDAIRDLEPRLQNKVREELDRYEAEINTGARLRRRERREAGGEVLLGGGTVGDISAEVTQHYDTQDWVFIKDLDEKLRKQREGEEEIDPVQSIETAFRFFFSKSAPQQAEMSQEEIDMLLPQLTPGHGSWVINTWQRVRAEGAKPSRLTELSTERMHGAALDAFDPDDEIDPKIANRIYEATVIRIRDFEQNQNNNQKASFEQKQQIIDRLWIDIGRKGGYFPGGKPGIFGRDDVAPAAEWLATSTEEELLTEMGDFYVEWDNIPANRRVDLEKWMRHMGRPPKREDIGREYAWYLLGIHPGQGVVQEQFDKQDRDRLAGRLPDLTSRTRRVNEARFFLALFDGKSDEEIDEWIIEQAAIAERTSKRTLTMEQREAEQQRVRDNLEVQMLEWRRLVEEADQKKEVAEQATVIGREAAERGFVAGAVGRGSLPSSARPQLPGSRPTSTRVLLSSVGPFPLPMVLRGK